MNTKDTEPPDLAKLALACPQFCVRHADGQPISRIPTDWTDTDSIDFLEFIFSLSASVETNSLQRVKINSELQIGAYAAPNK